MKFKRKNRTWCLGSTHFSSPSRQICEHAEGGDGTEKSLGLKINPFELKISDHSNFGVGMTNSASYFFISLFRVTAMPVARDTASVCQNLFMTSTSSGGVVSLLLDRGWNQYAPLSIAAVGEMSGLSSFARWRAAEECRG